MSVTLICPKCGKPAVYHHGSISTEATCGTCGELFPEELRQTAAHQLATQNVPRPVPLTIGMILANIWGTVWLLALLGAPMNVMTFEMNGEEVSGGEFLKRAGINIAVMVAVSFGIAYGIWKEKAWSRHLMLFFWAVMFVIGIVPLIGIAVPDALIEIIFSWAMGVALSIWYLYGKANVRAYYRRLENTQIKTD